MQLYQQVLLLFVLLFLVLLVIFIYTQYFTTKKQITLVNKNNESIKVDVDVADDQAKRMRGLMFRKSLGENEGMLFVFDSPGRYGFWMVNTSIALDAIYFDSEGKVVDIIEMEPCGISNCPVYMPEKDALYVLEVNKGFSVANKIEKGKSTLILE